MIKSICNLFAILTFLLVNPAHSSGNKCTEIKEADKRLECFDSQFKRENSSNKNNDDPTVNMETSPEGTQDENYIGNKGKSLFDWEGAEPFISKIKKIRSREKQRMVFLLENDHVWIQIEPRPQPFREGEQVSIKAGLMGGFNMRSESGAFTRVRRIQ